jgi:hypothetical protein
VSSFSLQDLYVLGLKAFWAFDDLELLRAPHPEPLERSVLAADLTTWKRNANSNWIIVQNGVRRLGSDRTKGGLPSG